ncbi:MAG TPA: pirin family protein [Candidatus Limnocylindria bacterium]|jgi:redox-sensitive bicupin YhaK (pirin superfamily)
MPAVTSPNILALPAVQASADQLARPRPVRTIVTAIKTYEGEGFPVRRPFPGLDRGIADPFLLLDQMGEVQYAPGEAKGAPDHPHRGFETVTYMIDGEFVHRDSTGGGGVIANGSTQWMTAGAGIVHSEMPPEALIRSGGLFHGIQLWVNLPAAEKWTPARYQDIAASAVTLVRSADGGALVRVIAGEIGGHRGPGETRTPIAYAHATLAAGARLDLPWREDFNALVYALSGFGRVGAAGLAIESGQLAVFGPGGSLCIEALPGQDSRTPSLDVLILGGRPIGEPVVQYGPFVMNTRDEIVQAIADYQSGRMGSIPATHFGAGPR